jgi:hypothetical protein
MERLLLLSFMLLCRRTPYPISTAHARLPLSPFRGEVETCFATLNLVKKYKPLLHILLQASPFDRVNGAAIYNPVHIARDHCRVSPTFSQMSTKSGVNDLAITDSREIGSSGSASGRFSVNNNYLILIFV